MTFNSLSIAIHEDLLTRLNEIRCSNKNHDDTCTCNQTAMNGSSWTADTSDKDQWIEIDLGITKLVTQVVTQGNPESDQWVTKYKVQYKGEKTDKWEFVTDDAQRNDGMVNILNMAEVHEDFFSNHKTCRVSVGVSAI